MHHRAATREQQIQNKRLEEEEEAKASEKAGEGGRGRKEDRTRTRGEAPASAAKSTVRCSRTGNLCLGAGGVPMTASPIGGGRVPRFS